jgi:hypothetical protein
MRYPCFTTTAEILLLRNYRGRRRHCGRYLVVLVEAKPELLDGAVLADDMRQPPEGVVDGGHDVPHLVFPPVPWVDVRFPQGFLQRADCVRVSMDQVTALQSREIGKTDEFCRNAGKNR